MVFVTVHIVLIKDFIKYQCHKVFGIFLKGFVLIMHDMAIISAYDGLKEGSLKKL